MAEIPVLRVLPIVGPDGQEDLWEALLRPPHLDLVRPGRQLLDPSGGLWEVTVHGGTRGLGHRTEGKSSPQIRTLRRLRGSHSLAAGDILVAQDGPSDMPT